MKPVRRGGNQRLSHCIDHLNINRMGASGQLIDCCATRSEPRDSTPIDYNVDLVSGFGSQRRLQCTADGNLTVIGPNGFIVTW